MRMDLIIWKYHFWGISKLNKEVWGLFTSLSFPYFNVNFSSFSDSWESCYYTFWACRDYSKTYARAKYYDEAKPWNERCDVAIPCGSQNEIDQADAINLVNSGCRILVEGSSPWYEEQTILIIFPSQRIIILIILANSCVVVIFLGSNMPCTPEAVDVLKKANVLIAPAMAAGSGGVRSSLYPSWWN